MAEALQQGRVGLGQHGPDRRDRNQPITTVVIHHSGTEPGVSQERLSAMGLLRLYAPVHLDARAYPLAYKQPVYSGHWSGGRQVFYAYHWLVRTTGQVEHLLSDHRVGWHSGNWDVNTTSIGICLAGDYSTSRPNNSMLCSLHDLLARYAPTTVLTHSLVNPQTSCPGTWVSREDWNQWKCCKG